jgi:hypothetical protein
VAPLVPPDPSSQQPNHLEVNGMESLPGDNSFDAEGLSKEDLRILATLESSFEVSKPRWLNRARVLLRLRLLVIWCARATIWSGLVISGFGLATLCIGLSTHLCLAIGGEGLLVIGTLLLTEGSRMWWHGRHIG